MGGVNAFFSTILLNGRGDRRERKVLSGALKKNNVVFIKIFRSGYFAWFASMDLFCAVPHEMRMR